MPQSKPRDDQLDVYGLTHTGKLRKENQDHFLICSLGQQVTVHLTSLPDVGSLTRQRLTMTAPEERLAFLAMVADGVGGGQRGADASRIAVEAVTQYVAEAVRAFYASGDTSGEAFGAALQEAALRSHADIVRAGEADPTRAGMATTLTLWLGVWPDAYLLQLGDSRCYVLREGALMQVSRDQTMAQELLDSGALSRTEAGQSRFAHILSSSLGGSQTAPVVTRMEQRWGQVGLLCSDGLTKHVSDERIRDVLQQMISARQACELLLEEALAGGGSDNITIVIGRAVQLKTN